MPAYAVIREALSEVIDPDLGVNVVDLGFVLAIEFEHGVAALEMTLTSPACPLTGVIEDQIRTALLEHTGGLVRDFSVSWKFSPPWTPDRITSNGREQLTAIGFSV